MSRPRTRTSVTRACVCNKTVKSSEIVGYCDSENCINPGPYKPNRLEEIREEYKEWNWPNQGGMYHDIKYLLSIIDSYETKKD